MGKMQELEKEKNKQNKTNNPFITIQEKNSHFL